MSYEVKTDNRAAFDRVSQSLAEILAELAAAATREEQRTRPARRRAVADIRRLIAELAPEDESEFMRELTENVQRMAGDSEIIMKDTDVTTTAMAKPKIGVSRGCVGRDGGGIEGSFGGVTVKICVIGSLDSGIQGGGIEITHPY